MTHGVSIQQAAGSLRCMTKVRIAARNGCAVPLFTGTAEHVPLKRGAGLRLKKWRYRTLSQNMCIYTDMNNIEI